ncbi:altered inheritance of mitochondria protein 44-like [Impatiens glandulifera]|uniref:altered inheritance of mitochondria protein 44-like n=1 Tax=Impatiens glandulifera TaxID=253017 RepID=UPI001FB0B9F9|nr:altered inheritance of mitochondria protein 44-like [Impatiens glandulifera]
MAESETRIWSDLLPELVSAIAEKLGLIDLLALRGTCRSWRLASFSVTAKLKDSILHQMPPWLLCQDSYDNEECIAHDLKTKIKYRMKLPQLIGTKILGCFQGWLLLFNTGGKIFFFCPFTKEKISLPDLPQSEICLHTKSVLTSSPTSITDRTICLIWREQNPFILFYYILQPGAESWNKGKVSCNIDIMKVETGAVYYDGEFILLNRVMGKEVTFSIESQGADICNLMLDPFNQEKNLSNIKFSILDRSYLKLPYVKQCLSMEESDEDDDDDYEEYDDDDDEDYEEEDEDDYEEEDDDDNEEEEDDGDNEEEDDDDDNEEEDDEFDDDFYGEEEDDEDQTATRVYVWGTHWHNRSRILVCFFNESNFNQRIFPNISEKNLGRRGIWIHPRLFTQLNEYY